MAGKPSKPESEIRHIQMNQHYGEHGTVTFSTLQALAANKVAKASLTGALPVNDLRKNWIIGYVQDEFKLRPNFTLNLGARYTVFQLFHEAHGKANPFDFATCGPQGFCGVGASFGYQNYGDFDPRVGLAWSPGGTERRSFAPDSESTTKMASWTIRICPPRTKFPPTR